MVGLSKVADFFVINMFGIKFINLIILLILEHSKGRQIEGIRLKNCKKM